MIKLPTIAMSPMPEYGYDPIPLILSGEKAHTLRKYRCFGRKEITVKGKRTGIIIEFWEQVFMVATAIAGTTFVPYLTDEFAVADGFRATSADKRGPMLSERHWSTWTPAQNLRRLLEHFYKEVPETMWCNHFTVLESPKEEGQ